MQARGRPQTHPIRFQVLPPDKVNQSLAILAIGRNETPFLDEWVEYHLNIGINRIYYISTDDDFDGIRAHVTGSRFRDNIKLFHFCSFEGHWQLSAYNQFRSRISEDWILVLDVDEFLYLNHFSDVSQFLDWVPDTAGQVQFPWANCIPNGYSFDQVTSLPNRDNLHVFDHVKSMTRSDVIAGLGVHRHNFKRGKNILSSGEEIRPKSFYKALLQGEDYYETYPFIIHMSTRGHIDTMLRIADHKFNNTKSGPGELARLRKFLNGDESWHNIPNRILLLLFYRSLPKIPINVTRPKLPKLYSKTNHVELTQILDSLCHRFVDFHPQCFNNYQDEFEKQFHLSKKMDSNLLAVEPDLEHYQRCLTQLNHVKHLRDSAISRNK